MCECVLKWWERCIWGHIKVCQMDGMEDRWIYECVLGEWDG